MDFSKTLKVAMINKNIVGAKALSELSGVSYHITLRLLRDDGSVRYKDLRATADVLDVNINIVSKGE